MKYLNRHFTKRNNQIANKHIENFPKEFIIRAMQIRTTMRKKKTTKNPSECLKSE